LNRLILGLVCGLSFLMVLKAEEVTDPKGEFSGSLRFRSEYFRNFGLYEKTRAGNDDGELLHQLRGDIVYQRRVGDENHLFLQGRATHLFGDNDPTANFRSQEEVRLHQAWMRFEDLWDDWDLKLGRQELSFSNEVLVGVDDWSQNGRSFDAIRLSYEGFSWDLDLFHSLVQEGTGGEEDSRFSGIHGTHMNAMRTVQDIYLYHLYVPTGHAPFDSLTNLEANIFNLGYAVEGKLSSRLSAQAMFNIQQGEFQDLTGVETDHDAHHFYLNLDWFLNHDVVRNIGIDFSYATGDKLGTTENETYMPLFSSPHTKGGAMDWFSQMNSVIYTLYLMFEMSEKWDGYVELHHFQLQSNGSAWYLGDLNTAWWDGTPRVNWPSDGVSSKDAGTELDLHWTWNHSEDRVFHFGYSLFLPGELLKSQSWWNQDREVHWAYFQTELSF